MAVRSTSQSMEIANFLGGKAGVRTPEPIGQKFGLGDYISDDSPHTKTQKERPIGDIAAYA